jgi:two-component system sensor histidine kinase CiaH
MNIQSTIHKIRQAINTPTFSLTGTYLVIIMIMSLGFSIVFYNTSSHELGRQIPPNSLINNQYGQARANAGSDSDTNNLSNDPSQQPAAIDQFLQQRASEGRDDLFTRLVILNAGALIIGSGVSYILARRNLTPIEQAMENQAQFVSDASHELRTPLTAIQTSNDVALRDPKLTLSKAKKIIAENTEEAIKLKQLSDGLLNLAKQDNSEFIIGQVDLQDMVSTAINQIIPVAVNKDIAVDDVVPAIKVVAHNQALTQIVVILLDNAIKYSDAKTTIHIEGRVRGRSAFLSVRDEGIGIRASDLPHIFRRFYRADTVRSTTSPRSGYGLGLSIAQKLAHQQQATIAVTSEVGSGTTFTLKLPLA